MVSFQSLFYTKEGDEDGKEEGQEQISFVLSQGCHTSVFCALLLKAEPIPTIDGLMNGNIIERYIIIKGRAKTRAKLQISALSTISPEAVLMLPP